MENHSEIDFLKSREITLDNPNLIRLFGTDTTNAWDAFCKLALKYTIHDGIDYRNDLFAFLSQTFLSDPMLRYMEAVIHRKKMGIVFGVIKNAMHYSVGDGIWQITIGENDDASYYSGLGHMAIREAIVDHRETFIRHNPYIHVERVSVKSV